jgi:hypothetical protein
VLRIVYEMQCEHYEKYRSEDDPSHLFLLELVNALQKHLLHMMICQLIAGLSSSLLMYTN